MKTTHSRELSWRAAESHIVPQIHSIASQFKHISAFKLPSGTRMIFFLWFVAFLEPQQWKLRLALLITAAVCPTPLHGGNAVYGFFLGEGETELCTSLAAISFVLFVLRSPAAVWCFPSLSRLFSFPHTDFTACSMFFLVSQVFLFFLAFI